jgi:hypothetical protein
MTGESDVWPRPIGTGQTQEAISLTDKGTLDPAPNPTDDDDVPAHTHDQAELRAVERVLAILVRDAGRATRRQIRALLDDMEAHR